MLESIELLLTPSCLDCLSWSDDGDLAIAAGENIYILTPKPTSSENTNGDSSQSGADQWVITKLQTNLFTNEEWAPVLPQPGKIFSVGEEQSESHVVSLSWSSPGLAAYGYCVLGVLTSGLVLSLWESTDGRAQWTRIAVLNHSLQRNFSSSINDQFLLRQKQRVRAFSWSPVCKIQARDSSGLAHPTLRKRHERHLLAACNDVNEIVILDTSDPTWIQDGGTGTHVDVINVFQLPPLVGPPNGMEPHSLFSLARQNNSIVTDISWGPWVEKLPNDGKSYISAISLIRGSKLTIIRVEASVNESGFQLEMELGAWSLNLDIGLVNFTGPLSWVHAHNDGTISLISGTVEGCVSLTIPERAYAYPGPPSEHVVFQSHTLSAYKPDDARMASYDLCPISGIVKTSNRRSRTLRLDVANFSFHTTSLAAQDGMLSSYNAPNQLYETDWRSQVEEFRQQFDLDYDLEGSAMAKIWGLASFRGWIAACFSVHPAGQFEHYTVSQHYVRLVFARPFLGTEDEYSEAEGLGPWLAAKHDPETQERARAVLISFILDPENREASTNYPFRYKILYAAACCVLVQPSFQTRHLRDAKSAIEFIHDQTGINVSAEVSLIEEIESRTVDDAKQSRTATGPRTAHRIPAKSQNELSAPGALDVFETCLICGGGLEWYSATESQCRAGHVFPRCGMTFLSMQDPMHTKECSRCGVEALSDDILQSEPNVESDESRGTSMFELVIDRFDSCVYCGSKFRV